MDTFSAMTDEELVMLYAYGNNNAFNVLLDRHKQPLYTYIFYTVRHNGLAEDIFQDTFIKAITTIKQGRYTETGKFKAWLMRIAHNLMIDYFRQKKNENTVSNDDYEPDLWNNSSLCEDTIEVEMVRSQVLSDVKKLVGFLPDTQREVLEMRYYKDLSFKEIADQTGVSINTALGRMRYAVINMRKMAQDHKMVLTVD
ncbi:MAG: RNA polymerase subunit sigma-24 [Bacteroidetes bacterium GWD2_45_23]|jgi:RNA polymerase sigma-70 factor (ECF subfamily)|nr:sigma-70 family RNA polymerase sigma factor [Porphyromonadaceae bacterium]OFX52987.1 MAG: RNA polymerase subunit sigma-24 [Bacteroidetes bacterium GWC2_46_850]OFX84906.1 MAG: RNA polymerase subunit sigma-24 [Bacteroidetes bacterium GWD2_45_23]HBB00224.1 RNA polymerase subunit sigma-24 [Porphyromonadaceae bacterium]HCC17266.1 RNA polymerase subunit sigma-24 [Porphyromonadaceae bacterium]